MKILRFLKKSYQVLTVSVKLLCYNGSMKSAIRNPKSEMEGPYLSNAYAKVNPSSTRQTRLSPEELFKMIGAIPVNVAI